jgi:hypothetical protein
MPTWNNQVPEQPTHTGFQLLRTPPDKPLKGIVTCADLIGCYTHYWGGRTVPCERPDCEACRNQTPARWHCYVTLFNPATHDHFLFEATAKAAQPLIEWRDTYGTLLGCFVTAFRPKRRRNARVELVCKPADLTKIKLPQAPDIIKAMSVIWQLPAAALSTPSGEHCSPLVACDTSLIELQRSDSADHSELRPDYSAAIPQN